MAVSLFALVEWQGDPYVCMKHLPESKIMMKHWRISQQVTWMVIMGANMRETEKYVTTK